MRVIMSNATIEVRSSGIDTLRHALAIAFAHGGEKLRSFRRGPPGMLQFFWSEVLDSSPMPVPAGIELATHLIDVWLREIEAPLRQEHPGQGAEGGVSADGWLLRYEDVPPGSVTVTAIWRYTAK